MRYTPVIIEKDKTSGYHVFAPLLPGCHSQGETIEECVENIKEAIALMMEVMTDEELEEAWSRTWYVTTIEIETSP